MTQPDSELIARSVAFDDREAFGELVRRHQSAVRRFLRHLTSGDEGLSDDLAQETFIQAWRGLARFRGEAGFLSWIMGIAHNHWRNAWRRRRSEGDFRKTLGEPDAEPSANRGSDLREDLNAALRSLSDDERTAIHLCYQQGLSHSEAASVVAWPVGTVKTHLARAKEKLRNRLSEWSPQS